MSELGTVTHLLEALKKGNPDEPERKLFERYFSQMVALAHRHLGGRAHPTGEGEDVALSAFDGFLRSVREQRFPRLNDRDDLWKLLFVITVRKAANRVKAASAEKRGGGRVVHASAVVGDASDGDLGAPGREPDPAEAAAVADELEHLLQSLKDPFTRSIAVLKMEGYTNAEIAAKLGRAEPTIGRKLRLIRSTWEGLQRGEG